MARVGQATVVFKNVRARSGQVLNICTDRGTERGRNLHGRVASNDVASDHVATLRCASDETTIEVSADLVVLDQVVFTGAHQSDAEIVTHPRSHRGRS